MKNLIIIFILLFTLGFISSSQAQLFDKLKKKVEQEIKKEGERRTDEKIKEGVNKAYDEAENQLEGKEDEAENSEEKEQASGKNKKTDDAVVDNTEESTSSRKLEINSKYDFIPGEKIIFFDDFTSENIGDFPVQWNTTGSGEIVTLNSEEGRWFHITNGRGITTLDEPVTLPENYTIEFDVIPHKNPKNNNGHDFTFWLISTTKPKVLNYGLARPGEAGIRFSFEYSNHFFSYFNDGTPEVGGVEDQPKLKAENKYRISICVQKQRIRLYVDDEKLFDLPRAISKNYKYNMIRFDNGTPLITNVRIASGLPDMRSKLLTEGKLISYGIYFDVNKDIVKPESYPSIKEIAAILKDNPSLKIKISGHTDSDGEDKLNLDLSRRRAAAVKNYLVEHFVINESLIETEGKGESEPVAPNDSATNKGLNRRVEFIKI